MSVFNLSDHWLKTLLLQRRKRKAGRDVFCTRSFRTIYAGDITLMVSNQSWIFIGRTDVYAEVPILWPPGSKSRLIGNDPDVGKDWGQQKWVTEDEMIGCIIDSMDNNLSKLQEIVTDKEAWHAAVHEVAKSQKRLSDWMTNSELEGWGVGPDTASSVVGFGQPGLFQALFRAKTWVDH